MNPLLTRLAERLVKTGDLTITGPNGKSRRFGNGEGTPVHVVLRDRKTALAMALDPEMALPEAYMNGGIDIVEGDVLEFLKIVHANGGMEGGVTAWTRLLDAVRFAARRLQQFNPRSRSRRNVQHHYDLSGELYRLFLDSDMQYSCAYFEHPSATLEEAQSAKKRHITAKLRMQPRQRVLDIGSGWGGLGLYIARQFDAEVTGVTLSDEQYAVSKERARASGLDSRAHFELMDYRDVKGPFDRIVSVGMFEHVGVNHYEQYFDKCAQLLSDDGVMLVHTIGRTGKPASTSPFIRKHIFPGGYIPALSEIMPAIERTRLAITDVEVLRIHYAETLKNWRERFMANRDRAKAIYDERFCRMWEFYLAGSEASFRWGELVVFQIQLSKKNHMVPITRDYLAKDEKALRQHETEMPTTGRPEKYRQAAE